MLGKWFISIGNHYILNTIENGAWLICFSDWWLTLSFVFWLENCQIFVREHNVCFKYTKCHNDSHRHGTILKEVAFIFSFDLYNRFDCF